MKGIANVHKKKAEASFVALLIRCVSARIALSFSRALPAGSAICSVAHNASGIVLEEALFAG